MSHFISPNSFVNLGIHKSQNEKHYLNFCKETIIQLFIDNDYTETFIKENIDKLQPQQIYSIMDNLSELKLQLVSSKNQIIQYLSKPKDLSIDSKPLNIPIRKLLRLKYKDKTSLTQNESHQSKRKADKI